MQKDVKKNNKTSSSYFFENKKGQCLWLFPLVALYPFFNEIGDVTEDKMPPEIFGCKMFTTLQVTCGLNGWNQRNVTGNETFNKLLNVHTNKKDYVVEYNGGNISEIGIGELTFIPDNSKKQVKVLAISDLKNKLLELVKNDECANFYGRYDFWNRKQIALENNVEDKATNYDIGNDFSVISLFDNKDKKDKVNNLIHLSCSGFDTYDMVGVAFNDYLTQFFRDAGVEEEEYEWLAYYKNYNISIEGKLTTALGNGHIEVWRRKLLEMGCIMSPDDLAYQFANKAERTNGTYKFKNYKTFLGQLLSDESNGTSLQNALTNIFSEDKKFKKDCIDKKVNYNAQNKRFEMTIGNRCYDATPWLYYKCCKAIVSKMENLDGRKYDPFNIQDLSKFGGSKPKNKSFLDVTRSEEYNFLNAYRNILHQTQYRDGDPEKGLKIAQNAYLYFEDKSLVKHVIQFFDEEQKEMRKNILSEGALKHFFRDDIAKKILEQQEKFKRGDHVFISRFIEDIIKEENNKNKNFSGCFFKKGKLKSLLTMFKKHPAMNEQLDNLAKANIKVEEYYSDDKELEGSRDFSNYNIDVLEFSVLKSLIEYFVFAPESSLAYSSFWFRLQENVDYFVYHKAHPESTDGKDAIQKKYREMSIKFDDLKRKLKVAEEEAKWLKKADVNDKSLAEVGKKVNKIGFELNKTLIGDSPKSNLSKKISQDDVNSHLIASFKSQLLGYQEEIFDIIKPKIENFIDKNGLLNYENGEDARVVPTVDKIETLEDVTMFSNVLKEIDEYTDFVIDAIFEKHQGESEENYIKRIDGLMQDMKELDFEELDVLNNIVDQKITSGDNVKDFKDELKNEKNDKLRKLFVSVTLKQKSNEAQENYRKRLDGLMQKIQRLYKIRTQANGFIEQIKSELENHIGNLDYDRFIECVNSVCQSQGKAASNDSPDDKLKSLIINTRRQFKLEMKQTNNGISLLPSNTDEVGFNIRHNELYRNRAIMEMYQLTQDFMAAAFVLARKCDKKEKRQIILNAREVESLMNNNPGALLSKYNPNNPIDNLIDCLFVDTHFEGKEIYKTFVKQFALVFHQTNSTIPHMTQRPFFVPNLEKEDYREYGNGCLIKSKDGHVYGVPIQKLKELIGLKLESDIEKLDWFDITKKCGFELDMSEWTELSLEEIEKKIEAKKKGQNLIISELKEKTDIKKPEKPVDEKDKLGAPKLAIPGSDDTCKNVKVENKDKYQEAKNSAKYSVKEQELPFAPKTHDNELDEKIDSLNDNSVNNTSNNAGKDQTRCSKTKSWYIQKLLIVLGIIALFTGVVLFILPVAKWIAGCVLGAGLLSTGSGLMINKIIEFVLKKLFGSDSQHMPEGLDKNINSIYDKVNELENLPDNNNNDSPKIIESGKVKN